MKKLLTTCALLLTLTGCAVSGTDDVMSAQKETGLFGIAKDAVNVERGQVFAGTKDVVIGGFVVGFDVESHEARKAGGGLFGRAQGGRSSAKVLLTGVDNAVMQRITDAAYADFVAKLKAQGFNVVNTSVLFNDPGYATATSLANPYINKAGGLLTAAAESRYFAPSSFGKIVVYPNQIAGQGSGFGYKNPQVLAADFTTKSGNPRVLSVNYVVDFASSSGVGGRFSDVSNVKVGQSLSVAKGSGVQIVNGAAGKLTSNRGRVELGQPVDSQKAFATVTDTTNTAYKAAQYAKNIFTGLNGMGTNQSGSFEVRANPAQYQSASLEALSKANASLTSTMSSLR